MREWNEDVESLLNLWGVQLLIQIQRHKQAQWRSQIAHWALFLSATLCSAVATLTIWSQFSEHNMGLAIVIVTGVLQALGLFISTIVSVLGLNVAAVAHFNTWVRSDDLVRRISMTLGLERAQRQDMETFVSSVWHEYKLINVLRPLTLLGDTVELSHHKLIKKIVRDSKPSLAVIAADGTCDYSDSDTDTAAVNNIAADLVARNKDIFVDLSTPRKET